MLFLRADSSGSSPPASPMTGETGSYTYMAPEVRARSRRLLDLFTSRMHAACTCRCLIAHAAMCPTACAGVHATHLAAGCMQRCCACILWVCWVL